MTAATADAVPVPPADAPERAPALTAVAAAPVEDRDAGQLRAESVFWRTTMRGMAIGVFVCIAIWVGIVLIATRGNGTDLGPNLAMGAGCGVFAGLFLGGSAGALAGSRALEHAERAELPTAPPTAPPTA